LKLPLPFHVAHVRPRDDLDLGPAGIVIVG
jgi:hypothetical protein